MATITRKYQDRIDAIQTRCVITSSFGSSMGEPLHGCEVESTVWDSGATSTIISEEVVKTLGLHPIDKARIEGVGGLMDSSIYQINIYFENHLEFKSIDVLSGDIGDYDLIIGMDIITLGDFVVSNKDGKTWFSFQHPAKEHIEF